MEIKSKNWDLYGTQPTIVEGSVERAEMPPAHLRLNGEFEIVLRYSGKHYIATVNLDRQYSAEGLQWIAKGGDTLDPFHVICWKQLS